MRPGWLLRVFAAAALAAGAGAAAGQPDSPRIPTILPSPIQAGCKTYNAKTCQIFVEPFTIHVSPGKKLAAFQITVDGIPVYDFRPDQSNPPSGDYSPSPVMLGFGVRCGVSHLVRLEGRDTGDATNFVLGQTAPMTCPLPLDAMTFYSLPPCRVIDTRNSAGPDAGAPALAPSETRLVATAGKCGFPSTAAAISVNMAVTAPAAPGYLTLYPADATLPLASSINFSAGQTRSNNAVLPLAVDARGFKVLNGSAGTVHFILDVNGYFE